MPVAEKVDSRPEIGSSSALRRLRIICRIIVISLAACQLWTFRYATDADGTAYVDVARAYLHGDWAHALNAYWSPLYIWLVAAALGVFRPSVHWELPLLHIIAFAGFMAGFAAWEWLVSEWERWRGPSAHPVLTVITGYCVVLWAGTRLSDLGVLLNADIFVMALLVAATAILVRVRGGVAGPKDFVALGVVLGLGFLAKTAFLTVIPIFVIVLAILLRSWLNRRILTTIATAAAVMAPFVAALSISQKRFTMGDSGRINYSWQVTGVSVEGYKENAYWPGPEIHHPIRVLLEHPRVLSFEQHLFGTLPVHAEPAWWCEGYPVRFDKARQLMILWSNIRFSIYAFRCPALFLFLLCLPFGAARMMRSLAETWYMWAPALFFAATYCFVFSDYRYLAGSYAVIGFVLIAAAWHVRLPRSLVRGSTWAIPVLAGVFCMGARFRHLVPDFLEDISGQKAPYGYENVQTAEAALRAGLRPGDRVAYIGFSLGGSHVGLERAHIVAIVPETVSHDDNAWGRRLMFAFPKPHAFWRSSPQDQEKVFQAFRSVGAKWVFADTVPPSADTTGWRIAGNLDKADVIFRSGDRPYIYFRKL